VKRLILGATLVISTFAAARPVDREVLLKLRKEYLEIEMAMERFRRLIPPDFVAAAARDEIAGLARKAGVSSIGVKVLATEPLKADGATPIPLNVTRIELSGTGAYGDLSFLLGMIIRQPRAVGIESLRFDAAANGDVRYVARLAYLSWSEVTPERKEPTGDPVTDVRRAVARNRAVLEGSVAAVARKQRSAFILDALASFTKSIDEQTIALTTVRIDDNVHVDGVLVGSAAQNALRDGLAAAKLNAGDVKWSAVGPCRSVSFSAQYAPADNAPESPSFTPAGSVFDPSSAAFCRDDDAAPARTILAGGTASSADAYFLRLRNVDLADVFFVLHDLLAESFLVHDDARGRVSLDVREDANVDDIFNALRSNNSVTIGAKPLRRVTTAKLAPASAPAAATQGTPIEVSVKDAAVSDLLCLLGQVTSRELRVAPDMQRRVSLFMTNIPAETAIDALLPKPSGTGTPACELAHSSGSESRLSRKPFNLDQLAIADVRIAGLARVGKEWRAYAMTPARRVLPFEIGQRFSDGTVQSIGAKGITFTSASGMREIAFAP
jgi:hypothetical protein